MRSQSLNRLCVGVLAVLAGAAAVGRAAESPSPNFVIFLTDDLGWGDLGCFGHPRIQTPNLDRFAKEGLRLTQCYSACSVCSPSRSAILTGRTPYRNGVWRWIPEGSQVHLRASEITIASLLQQRGYDTCHVGKWHLNGLFNSDQQPQPDDHGYDHWLATQNNAAPHHLNPTNFVRNGQPAGQLQGPSSTVVVEEAIRWLSSRPDPQTPFFLTVWTHEPHLPIETAAEFMEPYRDLEDEGLRQHHGNVTQLDHAFGQLMTALERLGQRERTFVMFTSDNGPEGDGQSGRTRGSTGGLRGRKRHSHEGGIRVPGIIRWPGRVPAGTESSQPVIGSDLFTTICDVVQIPLPADRTIDGASMLPLFQNQPIQRSQPLYWRNHLAPEQYRLALRVGDWKIVGSDDLSRFELYNLGTDPEETTDLAQQNPEKFEELTRLLIQQDAAVLQEGPEWWKDDPPAKPGRRRAAAAEPQAGQDQTGEFAAVLGGTVSKTEFGYRLDAAGEGLALWKLEPPITGRATLTAQYRSSRPQGNVRNAALVLGSELSNRQTIKIGTAIGLGTHVAFQGGWENVGALARVTASFEPRQTFVLSVAVDVPAGTLEAQIDGQRITARLPADAAPIRCFGYYTKGSASEFGPVTIER